MSRLLLIDDDVEFCEMMADYLKAEGFEVSFVHNGSDGLEQVLAAPKDEYDLILLDIMLPGINGFEVLQRVRPRQNTPVIMLTSRAQETDRIVGLEIGADDFLAKPCNLRELLARIRAVLRRAANYLRDDCRGVVRPAPEKIVLGDIELDAGSLVVRLNGQELGLTSAEFSLLKELLKSAGHIVTREQLAHNALGRGLGDYDRSVDMHVSRLRKKLGNSHNGIVRIKTVRGVGFLYTIPNPFST